MKMLNSDAHRFWKNRSATSLKFLLITGKCDFFFLWSQPLVFRKDLCDSWQNSRGYFKLLNVNQELSFSDLVPAEQPGRISDSF